MNLLGIDIGTSAVKVILLGTDGKIKANVKKSYPVNSPQPLWSEQDPLTWWEATCLAVKKAMKDSQESPTSIKAIGLSGQMVGLTVLDRNGKVIRPCILWNDQRSVVETEEMTKEIGLKNILRETGNPLFATFVAPKLVWMRKNEPEKYLDIAHVLMPKDYIAYRLTGNYGTEVSDASGTCLLNVRERKWSLKMIQSMGFPLEWFPDCNESTDIAGKLKPLAAEECGLIQGIPVIAGAGDQPAQALGCGIVANGMCSVTIGTSGVVFAQGERYLEHPNGLLHSFCHCLRDQWYLMGVMLSAGGSLQWLRDTFAQIGPTDFIQMTMLASQSKPGCEGLLFLPYLTGERVPHNDPLARGGWIGLSNRHKPKHLIRSVIEGITFGLNDSLNLISDLGLPITKVYASGGAVESELWLQILADVFNKEVAVTSICEGAAYGAAMLAGIGIKEYSNAAEAAGFLIKTTKSFLPRKEESKIYADYYSVYKEMYPSLQKAFHHLSSLTKEYN